MAIGDDALAEGMTLVQGTQPANNMDEFENEGRDYIAQFFRAAKQHAQDLFNSISLSWSSITDKPSTFPPATHSHDQLLSGSRRLGIVSDIGGEVGWTTNENVAFYRNFFLPSIAAVTSSYRAMYINGDNRVGVTPSARKYKKDIQPKAYSLEAATALEVVNYRLRADVYGSADAPVEVGVIAEQLVDAGLSEFVIYGNDGAVESVAYERLALVALGALREVEARLNALEAKLNA